MCRSLGISVSGYYAWLMREPSAHARVDQLLIERMRSIRNEIAARITVVRMHAALQATGIRVGRKRVARLMRVSGLDRAWSGNGGNNGGGHH